MPVVNSQGDIIPENDLTACEQARNERLSKFQYPEHEKAIFRLTPYEFRIWLYAQNPRDALLWMSTEGLNKRIGLQLKPNARKLIADFFWRLCH